MNIQTVLTDTAIFALLSQVMNDVTGVINHESKITCVNITRVRANQFCIRIQNRFSVRM